VQQGTSSDADKATAVLALLKQIKLPADVQTFVNAPGANAQVASLITLLNATISGISALIGGK
jgi:hypothetical protein